MSNVFDEHEIAACLKRGGIHFEEVKEVSSGAWHIPFCGPDGEPHEILSWAATEGARKQRENLRRAVATAICLAEYNVRHPVPNTLADAVRKARGGDPSVKRFGGAAPLGGPEFATPEASARDYYVVLKKYLAEGCAGFVLPALASTLRPFLVPVERELVSIYELADAYARLPEWDCNDQELAGFVRRAVRLYETVNPEEKR